MEIELYSNVETTEAHNEYAKGAHGNVVEMLSADYVLVELFDDDGDTIDVDEFPVSKLRMVYDAAGNKV